MCNDIFELFPQLHTLDNDHGHINLILEMPELISLIKVLFGGCPSRWPCYFFWVSSCPSRGVWRPDLRSGRRSPGGCTVWSAVASVANTATASIGRFRRFDCKGDCRFGPGSTVSRSDCLLWTNCIRIFGLFL